MLTIGVGELKEKQNMIHAVGNAVTPQGTTENTLMKTSVGGVQETSEAKKKEGNGVTLELSKEAIEMFREQNEKAREQNDAVTDLAKILEIARRIANGDKVPAKDEQKLMEYSFELYQTAKSAASLQDDKDRKEYDSLFEEEEEGVTRDKLRELNRTTGSDVQVAESSISEPDVSVSVSE